MIITQNLESQRKIESLKNCFRRLDENRCTTPTAELLKEFNVSNVIGFVTTKYNYTNGYILCNASYEDKKEFGDNIHRIYSEKTLTTTIVKFNFTSGTISFFDNQNYRDKGRKRFLSPTQYKKVIFDNLTPHIDLFDV